MAARARLALAAALCSLLAATLSQDAAPPPRCELLGWNATAGAPSSAVRRVTLQRDNWNSHFLITEAAKIVSDALLLLPAHRRCRHS